MEQNKRRSREYVEVMPCPAVVISKETYKQMQENNNAKQNQERLNKQKEFFKNIKDETRLAEDEERTL